MNLEYSLKHPLPLSNSRVWRTYIGGKRLEEWKGCSEPKDGNYPEEWIASTVKAVNSGRTIDGEGLSRVILPDGSEPYLADVVDSPLGVLVKLLDAGERLTIQVHPDKAFARYAFRSPYGKTESWIVLSGRQIGGEEPYVLLGFKEGVTKESWRELFLKQDIEGMLDAMHRIDVHTGDTFIVHGGVPHAIGPGCFLLEVQEPTDFTLRPEMKTPAGRQLSEESCHMGLGFEKMLDCFHYDARNIEETLNSFKKYPKLVSRDSGYNRWELIGPDSTDCFLVHRLDITTAASIVDNCDRDQVAFVLEGSGTLISDDTRFSVHRGDSFFVPSETREAMLENEFSGEELSQKPLSIALIRK